MQADLKKHFDSKAPAVLKTYERLLAEVKKFGRVKVEPKKTSIHLVNRYGFAGVYTRSDYINLELHLDHEVKDKRIEKVEQASANRFHHRIKLTSEKDVDKQLVGWLREAYELKA